MNKKAQAFQKTFYNFIFLALIIAGALTVTFILQEDNSVGNPLSNNTLFNDTATSLRSSMGDSETSSKTQQTNFNAEQPRPGFGSITLFSIVSSGKTFTNMIYSFFNLILQIPRIVLGIDSMIFSAIIIILAISLIIGIWIIYKIGG